MGEHIEKPRDEMVFKEINGEEFITIKGSKISDNEELFKRSAIATNNSSFTSNNILEHILGEGVTCLIIKPMGGMLHLSFETNFIQNSNDLE